MTNKLDTGGPAFGEQYDIRHQPDFETVPGMTWLDYTAVELMAAMLVNGGGTKVELVKGAYEMAQMMLAEKRRLEGGGE